MKIAKVKEERKECLPTEHNFQLATGEFHVGRHTLSGALLAAPDTKENHAR